MRASYSPAMRGGRDVLSFRFSGYASKADSTETRFTMSFTHSTTSVGWQELSVVARTQAAEFVAGPHS